MLISFKIRYFFYKVGKTFSKEGSGKKKGKKTEQLFSIQKISTLIYRVVRREGGSYEPTSH